MASPLDLLTSPSGARGGGGSVPSGAGNVSVSVPVDIATKSGAQSSLDSSGSAYDLRSNASTGNFTVGGLSTKTMLTFAALAIGGILLFKFAK